MFSSPMLTEWSLTSGQSTNVVLPVDLLGMYARWFRGVLTIRRHIAA